MSGVDSERSSRFHNAARALFSSYAPFSRCLVSPFSRSSVGQRTFSSAAFQRCAASASDFFVAAIPAKIYRSDMDGRIQGLFLHLRKANGPASPFPYNKLEKFGGSVRAELRQKKSPLSWIPCIRVCVMIFIFSRCCRLCRLPCYIRKLTIHESVPYRRVPKISRWTIR